MGYGPAGAVPAWGTDVFPGFLGYQKTHQAGDRYPPESIDGARSGALEQAPWILSREPSWLARTCQDR